MAKIEQEYHGQTIQFDEGSERWFIYHEGKQQSNASIKIIKNFIDRLNKKAFDRIPIYVEQERSYYSRNEIVQGYEEATITSIGIDGTVFIVRNGQKSASHGWGGYLKSEKNKKLIDEIIQIRGQIIKLKIEEEKKEKSLEKVDTEKLRRQVLGEKIS